MPDPIGKPHQDLTAVLHSTQRSSLWANVWFLRVAFLVLFSTADALATDCISFAEARRYIGKTQCIAGTIVHVKEGAGGVTYLDFCDDYEVCPFTVIVFAEDLRKVGDIRQLKGHSIQIMGRIEEYDGRAEIILKHPQQLGEAASLLPPRSKEQALAPSLPSDYDVERRGHYSAGKLKHPEKTKASSRKKQGAPISTEDPNQAP